MSIIDTRITDWSTTKTENVPVEGQSILRDLPGQFRNLKSVARAESLRKHQEQPAAISSFTYISDSIIEITASNLDEVLHEGRIVYAYGPSFVEAIGWIRSSVNTLGSTWRITVSWTFGQWADDATEIRLGEARLSPCSTPLQILRGRLLFTDDTVGPEIGCEFRGAFGGAFDLRDEFYNISIQAVRFHTDRSLAIIKSIERQTDGFIFTVGGTQVIPAGAFVEYEWAVIAAPWW